MPVSHTGVQELLGLDVDVEHTISHDPVGNTILELVFPKFPAYATRTYSISARVRMQEAPERQRLRDGATFLASEPYIETTASPIRRLAAEVKGANETATMSSIYNWVRSHLSYAGFVADDLGAEYAMRERRGDCTEYAYLTAALARANGIPARVMGGYVTSADTIARSRDYHNWAELYVDGAWRLVDAQKERLQTNAAEYVAMRIISSQTPNALRDNHRFIVVGGLVASLE
jgi:transglutaminase-like putative cysteine protease